MKYQQTKTIGGTAVSQILGLNPWSGPWDAWDRILNGTQIEPNEAMERGTRLEGPIAEIAQGVLGFDLVEPAETTTIIDDVFSASVDRFGYIDGKRRAIIEIKTASKYATIDPVPNHYWLQVQHYLWAFNLDRGVLVALQAYPEVFRMLDTADDVDFALQRNAAQLIVHEIERDPNYGELTIPKLRNWFERHIVGGEIPDIDGSKACRVGLFGLHEERTAEGEAEPELASLLLARQEIRATEARQKEERELVENQIRAQMASRRKVTADGLTCTLSKNNRLTFKEAK